MFSFSWDFDFFHIGLLIVVIMILITGMVICVSVIGVCCFHWLEGLEENRTQEALPRQRSSENSCQYDHQNQAVHVVVLPEKLKGGIGMDPSQLREHFQRLEVDLSHRRSLHEERAHHHQLGISLPPQPQPPDDGPPPSYDMLYPGAPITNNSPPK